MHQIKKDKKFIFISSKKIVKLILETTLLFYDMKGIRTGWVTFCALSCCHDFMKYFSCKFIHFETYGTGTLYFPLLPNRYFLVTFQTQNLTVLRGIFQMHVEGLCARKPHEFCILGKKALKRAAGTLDQLIMQPESALEDCSLKSWKFLILTTTSLLRGLTV